MKSLSLILLALATFASSAPISLFNGKDLTGWTIDVPEADQNPAISPSFIVRDGLLVSLGTPKGHLITQASYENYKLEIEYRFSKEPGNCGVLVHSSKLRALGKMFPQSMEVQMMHQNAGDFWCIQENIKVPEMETRRPRKTPDQPFGGGPGDARNIKKLVDGAEKPVGEWNTMTVECKGAEIIVHVNGLLVNHGTQCTATSGKIALQAEGSEVEFRKLELTRISP
jgi:hypothetical protein